MKFKNKLIREEFAAGDFGTTKENLANDWCNLMKGIPTDLDRIEIKNSKKVFINTFYLKDNFFTKIKEYVNLIYR